MDTMGIIGMSLGVSGFTFAMLACSLVQRLEKRVAKLELGPPSTSRA